MTRTQLNEMLKAIAVRDMKMTPEVAEMWFKSAGAPCALGVIAQYWWVHEIVVSEAAEVRKQLKHLAVEGFILSD